MYIKKLTKAIEKAVYGVSVYGAGIALILIIGIVVLGVIARRLFRSPLPFTLESSEMLLLIAVLCTLAFTLQLKGHVRVDLLLHHLSKKNQIVLEVITSVISLFLFVVLFLGGWDMFLPSLKLGYKTAEIQLPYYLIRWALPVGLGLLLLQGLIMAGRNIRELFAPQDKVKGSQVKES